MNFNPSKVHTLDFFFMKLRPAIWVGCLIVMKYSSEKVRKINKLVFLYLYIFVFYSMCSYLLFVFVECDHVSYIWVLLGNIIDLRECQRSSSKLIIKQKGTVLVSLILPKPRNYLCYSKFLLWVLLPFFFLSFFFYC